MSALLTTPITITLSSTDPNTVLANCPAIELGADKRLSIECIIDNGTDNAAPTDSPQGSFRLYFSGDKNNAPFVRNLIAETNTAGVGYLVDINPTGNNALVQAYANFTDCPGRYCKILWVWTAGTTARCRLFVTEGVL
jgi:hypothetical protein